MSYSLLSKYRSELMGMAILWVMFFHAYDLDMGLPVLEWVRAAGFGGVDIFIVLSAMGLVVSLSRREQEYLSFMGRRLHRLLPAYFIVMVPYTLFLMSRGEANLSSLIYNSLFLNYWGKWSGSFNWYMTGILVFYLLTPVCFRVLKPKSNRWRIRWAVLGSMAALVVCQIFLQEQTWTYNDFFYRIPDFCIGLLLGFFLVEKKKFGKADGLWWLCSALLGVCYLWAYPRLHLNSLILPLAHLFVFTTVPMCLALCFLMDRLPLGWVRRFFRLLGSCSLEIYLLNVSFFSQLPLIHQYLVFGPTNRLFHLILFTVNILLGIGLHKLLARVLKPAS